MYYYSIALSRNLLPPLVYHSKEKIEDGSRVIAPVRSAKRLGYVVGVVKEPTFKTRDIIKIVDEKSLLNEMMIKLAHEMAHKYISPIGEMFDLFFPPSSAKNSRRKSKKNKYITLKSSISKLLNSRLGVRETELVEYLLESNVIDYSIALKKFPYSTIQSLLRKGYVEIVEAEATSALKKRIYLNDGQSKIVNDVISYPLRPHLIYGVTGSGKTEVYFEIADRVLSFDKKVLLLVPEISLTPQLLSRTRARFPHKNIGVYHSALGQSRKIEWERAVNGKVDILLGTRSAVWVPIKNLGLIVVDEEQDESYKQYAMRPYYNAVDVARRRAELERTILLLASATPRVETYYAAKEKKLSMHKIDFRPVGKMPKISIVDMRHRKGEILSNELVTEMEKVARNGNQTFLFVPKKGFSTRIQCQDCGYIFTCPNCDVALTYHKAQGIIKCHYCGHAETIPQKCPKCGSSNITHGGVGTERVEQEVSKIFPGLRVRRIDREEINNIESLERVLRDISQMKVDIVVGTKMITKGLDFPRVALVGIVDADHVFGLPDFRATERAFQLVAQMSGRAGRGVEGRVMIQSREPNNVALLSVIKGRFNDFYESELKRRKALDYPPFRELILITAEGHISNETKKQAEIVSEILKPGPFEILGPVEASIFKLISLYRYQLLLKCDDLPKAIKFLTIHLKKGALGFDPAGVLKIDVQPYSTF